jgi:hypothetical protein
MEQISQTLIVAFMLLLPAAVLTGLVRTMVDRVFSKRKSRPADSANGGTAMNRQIKQPAKRTRAP